MILTDYSTPWMRRTAPCAHHIPAARGILVNTARGAIVDEAALARVLSERALAGAGLDVFVQVPHPPTSPLRRLDNLVLTPHLGWPADLTYRCMAEAVVQIVEAYLDGAYDRAVNPEALAHRRRA
jgi:phosphoglycerate dehydrogenase-like enzyme